MKKIKEWLELIADDNIRTNALRNYQNIPVEYWKDKSCESVYDAIIKAFEWVSSPEGGEYWTNIQIEKNLTLKTTPKFKVGDNVDFKATYDTNKSQGSLNGIYCKIDTYKGSWGNTMVITDVQWCSTIKGWSYAQNMNGNWIAEKALDLREVPLPKQNDEIKEGDIVVSINRSDNNRENGDLFTVVKITDCVTYKNLYYKVDTCTNPKNFRKATPEEVEMYNKGIRNINDKPIKEEYKVGDYIISITNDGMSSSSSYRQGDIHIITTISKDHTKVNTRNPVNDTTNGWDIKNFRKATQREIDDHLSSIRLPFTNTVAKGLIVENSPQCIDIAPMIKVRPTASISMYEAIEVVPKKKKKQVVNILID